MASVASSHRMSVARYASLTTSFPAAVDALKRRLAPQVGDQAISQFVSLGWLEWNGGGLKVTTVGENLCTASRLRAAD